MLPHPIIILGLAIITSARPAQESDLAQWQLPELCFSDHKLGEFQKCKTKPGDNDDAHHVLGDMYGDGAESSSDSNADSQSASDSPNSSPTTVDEVKKQKRLKRNKLLVSSARNTKATKKDIEMENPSSTMSIAQRLWPDWWMN